MAFHSWYRQIFLPRLLSLPSLVVLYISHYFSLITLLKTLGAPWKREDAFHLGLTRSSFLERLTLNVFSRLIGLSVRSITLLVGIVFLIIMTTGSLLVVMLGLLVPLTGLPFYKASQKNRPQLHSSFEDSLKDLKASPWWLLLTKRTNLDIQILFSLFSESSIPDEKYTQFVKEHQGESFLDVSFFMFLYDHLQEVQTYFSESLSIHKDDLHTLISWYTYQIESAQQVSFFNKEYILSTSNIGSNWSFGFTPYIDSFCDDLSKRDWRFYNFVDRGEELPRLIQLLNRPTQPFVILHGKPGVGRKSLVSGLAKKIAWHQVPEFSNKRIIWLEPSNFLDMKTSHSLAVNFKNIIEEASRAGNVILVINNLHELLEQNKDPDFKASQVLNTILSHHAFPVIGITTTQDFHRHIISDAQIQQLFSALELDEMNLESILLISYLKALEYEKNTYVTYLYEAIKACVDLSQDYIAHDVFPEKAIDLIEKASVMVNSAQEKVVKLTHIEKLIQEETGIQVGSVDTQEAELLLHLEEKIQSRVIGQDEAINQIAKAIRRSRTQISSTSKPIGSFIFLGPTGVGKTTTAQAVADLFFTNAEMIRFDMAEYQTAQALDRLLGNESYVGELAEKIRQHPYTVLLLDEFEKAPRQFHNLFLTILDEGYFVTANGITIDCTNLIIIATSNAASEEMRQYYIEHGYSNNFQEYLIKTLIENGYFSPELINRFDDVIYYKPLSDSDLFKVVGKELADLAQRLKQDKEIEISWNDGLIKDILIQGYDPVFGVRSIKRYIKNTIEDKISLELIKDRQTKQINLS